MMREASGSTRRGFGVTILNRDERALELREVSFRPWHAPALRSQETMHFERATWTLERNYFNYSHWLTAHLPKILLLRKRGQLDPMLMPEKTGTWIDRSYIDESLHFFGINPARFRTFKHNCRIEVDELTLLGTDRFRPELLRLVRDACPLPPASSPHRRVYISRANAPRRRLLNEKEIWPLLKDAGFERVFMEELSFPEQVRLMRETAALVAPHGAGLTNVIFCPQGTDVVEIANLNFPNPNFYAVAAAMGHRYWVLSADEVGNVHPLLKDLYVDPEALDAVLDKLP